MSLSALSILPPLPVVPNPRDPDQGRYDDTTYAWELAVKAWAAAMQGNLAPWNALVAYCNRIDPADIAAVADNGANIKTVATNMPSVKAVADALSDVRACATNMPAILAAPNAATAAESAKVAAEKAKIAAEKAETNANASKNAAATSATTASTKAGDAATSATSAATQAGIATTKAGEADESAKAAEGSATVSSTKADEAEESAKAAAASATAANTAKTGAESAKTEAEAAKSNANTSKIAAADSAKAAAESAKLAADVVTEGIPDASATVKGLVKYGTTVGTAAQGNHGHPAQTTVSGNAGSATKLATARTFAVSGDITCPGVAFDGSGNAVLKASLTERAQALGNIGGAVSLNCAAGLYIAATVTAAATLNIAAAPAGGCATLLLELTNGGKFAVTWGMAPRWSNGVAPVLTAAGVDLVALTYRGGKWIGALVASNVK